MNRSIALDIETTGLSPKNGDRVIEIGEQMQIHRALDDAKLVAMIWLEMGKI